MTNFLRRSIQVILAHQAESGAYIASPTFPDYRYCWFRDGAFTAYAMDLVGEHESAVRFHEWAARTILRHAAKAEAAIKKALLGAPPGGDHLHTRYTIEGEESDDKWPTYQLDGFGTWLWALARHLEITGRPSFPRHWEKAASLVGDYLCALWHKPCFDLWEEYGDKIHVYTLAAIYGGLKAIDPLLSRRKWRQTTQDIADFVKRKGVRSGCLVKYLGSDAVDASLIGVATPYRLLPPDDPVMKATVARIESELRQGDGGLHRYAADTYYGGGEWVLLTAWLGWYYAEAGEIERAQKLLHWVESQADAEGHLPEQVPTHLLAPERYAEWVNRRGPIAKPLLWSHAMYLILQRAMAEESG